MNFGVIGIRSKHLRFFRESLERLFPSKEYAITHICGFDAPELRQDWPDLIWCDSPEALISQVDGVIIALREGYQHAALAEMALNANKPLFIDKPFTCDPEQARKICQLARELDVPCTGGSTFCFTKEVRALKANRPKADHYTISYMADPFTPFGGWYFYGSHLTDLCASLFGGGWKAVSASIQGSSVTANITYPGFTVTLHSTKDVQVPLFTAGEETHILDDQTCYDAGMAHFVNLIEGKETGPLEDLVSSTALLDAILSSI